MERYSAQYMSWSVGAALMRERRKKIHDRASITWKASFSRTLYWHRVGQQDGGWARGVRALTLVVDLAIAINVRLADHLVDLCVRQFLAYGAPKISTPSPSGAICKRGKTHQGMR